MYVYACVYYVRMCCSVLDFQPISAFGLPKSVLMEQVFRHLPIIKQVDLGFHFYRPLFCNAFIYLFI